MRYRQGTCFGNCPVVLQLDRWMQGPECRLNGLHSKTATLSTSSHPPSRGVLSEAFIPIALVPVCVPKKASSRKEMPTPGLTSFSPALSHRSCLRKWSLGFVALWSLSLQKQQRAPLRVSCSWKLRMEFLSVHLWLVIGLF